MFRTGAPLGSPVAVAMLLDAVFPDGAQRDLADRLLSERAASPESETAETLLLALSEELPPLQASEPLAAQALASLAAHTVATERALNIYSGAARENPDAVWWPVPNHPKRPRRATDELPWAKRTPLLDNTTPVGSAGSCFASEVAHRLQADGFNYVVTQPNLNATKGTHNSCCRWGTLFNVVSFRQLIERAYGAWTPPMLFAEDSKGAAYQLYDPWLEAITHVSIDEARASHAELAAAAREAFDQVEVFVFTMGLSEVWRLKATGDVLARMPAALPRHLVEPVLLSYEDNLAELERLWTLWKRHNPRVKLILSVSPIPLNATIQADEQHVIAATCEAKSILRSVAGAFARRHEDVFYFPSYDLVSYCITHPWTEDGRHVTRQTVDRVMGLFDHLFVRESQSEPLRLPKGCVVVDQRAGLDIDEVAAVVRALRDRSDTSPVAVLLSPTGDAAAAGTALSAVRHPGGLVALPAPTSTALFRKGLAAARLLVTRREDPLVRAVREQDLLPTSPPEVGLLRDRLAQTVIERQTAEVLQPLLHGGVAQLISGLLADRKRTLAVGQGTERGKLIHRQLFVASKGQITDAMHQLVQRNLPFRGPVPARGVLGSLSVQDLQTHAQTLQRDGLLVWPTRLDPDTVERMVAFAREAPCRPRITLGSHGPALVYPGAASARSVRYDFQESVLAQQLDAVSLALDPSLRAVVGAYLGCDAVLDFLHLWWSTSANPEDAAERHKAASHAAQQYHWDLPRTAFVKVFVYLTDVTPDTGPHCYIRGSHRNKPAPLFRDGRISDAEIAAHYPAEDHREICGPAGTILLADTRGFHKGKSLGAGERLLFQAEFSAEHFGAPFPRVLMPDSAPDELVQRVRDNPRAYRHFEVPQSH